MEVFRITPGRAYFYSLFLVALTSPALSQEVPLEAITVDGATAGPAPAAAVDDDADDANAGDTFEGTNVVKQAKRTDSVAIVNRGELDEKRSSVAYDALETKPGLNVVRRLGFTGAGLSRLSIRGNGSVGPAGIQVYVDGRPDATVSFAHPTPSALNAADIESIEVISGPSPVLNGSGKTGAVNITTKDPEKGLHGYLETNYGKFESTQNFAGISYGGDAGYVRFGASYRETDGFNPDSDADIRSINFKGKLKFSEMFNIVVSAQRNEDDFNVFREFFVPGPFTDPRTERLALKQTVADVTLNADFGNVQSSLKFFYDDLEPTSQVLDAPERRADVTERGIRFKTTWAATSATKVITGVDYLEARAENSPVLPPFGGPLLSVPRARVSEELDELAFYAFLEQRLTDEITVSGGIRHIEHSAYGGEQAGEIGVRYSPQVSNTSNIFYGTTFRARATRGYQSPTLQQLYGVFRGGRGGPANPNVGPEIVEQYEIGFHKAFRNGSFDIVGYIQDGELIELPARPTPNPNFPPPPPFFPPPDIQNNLEFYNKGIEVKLNYSPTRQLDTFIGVTISDLDQETNRFLRAPEKTFDFGVTYRTTVVRPDDLTVSVSGRYAMDTFDVPFTPSFPPLTPAADRIKLDDYFVADVKVSFEANDNATIYVGIDNITDEDYELVSGIPASPLSIYGGLRLKM